MPDGGDFGAALSLADLTAHGRWVAWQTELVDGRPRKVPYIPTGSGPAAMDDPGTWGDAEQAKRRLARLPRPLGSGGIGIALGVHEGLALGGVDLDTCRAETGDLAPWALRIMDRFRTYAEVSPSETGVKLFFRYDPADLAAIRVATGTKTGRQWKAEGDGDHPPAVEFYYAGRYFAVTGQHLPETPKGLRLVPLAELEWLIREGGPQAFAKMANPSGFDFGRRTSGDGSRSGAAMSCARRVKRAGGTYQDFLAALDADPATAAWKAEKGMPNGEREARRAWERCNAKPPGERAASEGDIELTEDGVACLFEERHRGVFRFCEDTGQWHRWTGARWAVTMKGEAFTWARNLVRSLNREATEKLKAISAKAAFASAVETFAKRGPLAIQASRLDRDPFLLGTPGGTVDLQTGTLRPADPEEYITKLAAVAPAPPSSAPPDLWLRFLDDATGKDDDLIRFLQRWCGYCLTGDTREHALVFTYGPGGNGKSVFLNTVARILGDYATAAAMETFTASHGDKHPTDLAMLRGARLVTAAETEEGRAWAESRIKQMTGGDPITARFMRQDFFTFQPAFKLLIVGNHKPVLRNVDDAARRRFNLVPFTRKPAKPDRQLEEKLKAEWPAILRWMIEGCLAWQREGLGKPASVAEATAEYFDAQDTFGQWLRQRCALLPTFSTRPGVLLASFSQWCEANGHEAPSSKRFRPMVERTPGLRYTVRDGYPFVRGVRLLTEEEARKQADEAAQSEGSEAK